MSAPAVPELLAAHSGASVYHASWQQLAEIVHEQGGCDSLIVDAPYSERTHAGHNGTDRSDGSCVEVSDGIYGHRRKTRGINYAPWSSADVHAFVEAWSPIVRGWMVSITDDDLGAVWRVAFERVGRLGFVSLPLVEIGSRVRLHGDGPSSWTCQIRVARPREGEWLHEWRSKRRARGAPCSLPGAYVFTGRGDRQVMGGKTTESMRALVRDYSEPGELIVDPCVGAGTTLVSARLEGRGAIGGDILREHAELAAERVREMPTRDRDGTLALFGSDR